MKQGSRFAVTKVKFDKVTYNTLEEAIAKNDLLANGTWEIELSEVD